MSRPISKPFKFDLQWATAKKVCRLNQEDIAMAKALGMSPKILMKSNPSLGQRWKLPVKFWVRELYAERFGRKTASQSDPIAAANPARTETDFDENIPF